MDGISVEYVKSGGEIIYNIDYLLRKLKQIAKIYVMSGFGAIKITKETALKTLLQAKLDGIRIKCLINSTGDKLILDTIKP